MQLLEDDLDAVSGKRIQTLLEEEEYLDVAGIGRGSNVAGIGSDVAEIGRGSEGS